MKLFFLIVILASVSETLVFYFFRQIFGKPLKSFKNKSLLKNIIAVSIPILALMALLIQKQFNYVVLFFLFYLLFHYPFHMNFYYFLLLSVQFWNVYSVSFYIWLKGAAYGGINIQLSDSIQVGCLFLIGGVRPAIRFSFKNNLLEADCRRIGGFML